MIANLKGIVEDSDETSVIVDVGGVGYLVYCSGRTLGKMAVGDHVALLIETHVREEYIHLYGFSERAERDWFRVLTTVQGVGARVALAVLTVLESDALMTALAAGDKAALNRAAGVGPRLATRILSELKDKVGSLSIGGVVAGGPAGPADDSSAEAISALVNLGYSQTDVWRAVGEASRKEGGAAPVEALIRGALSVLAPKDRRL